MNDNECNDLIEKREQLIDQIDEINKHCYEMQLDREDLEYKVMEIERELDGVYIDGCIF